MKYKVILLTSFLFANSATIVCSARFENRIAEFTGLDKITGRILTFDVKINQSIQFGSLRIVPKVCYSRDDRDVQRVDAFTEISETTLDHVVRIIFSGWMFNDSPAMNAVDHPIYDVWLKQCKDPIKNTSQLSQEKPIKNSIDNSSQSSATDPAPDIDGNAESSQASKESLSENSDQD
ncbi:MAG: DUF2155 domain-containing protein [Candidatus Liberibacter ctenarytainae]|uniref:DUF2155 domain-containing protein n=1 Tax=Candidatus Liberibacter ctenarytainae TaxID=2020335 RepID=A0A937DH97_9HYPH|nr:DUF2155 domain-containing protein [Candidatus Liberibacter ctenarytainae]